MRLIHIENYEVMSRGAVDLLLGTLCKKPDVVICLATGNSPAQMHEPVCGAVNGERIDLSEIIFVKLDGWYRVEPQTARTYTTFIRERLLNQLYVQPETVVGFMSNAADIRQELDRMDVFLSEHSIGVMILRLEMNGHLGLNEPTNFLTPSAYYAELDEKTKTHDMVKGYEPKEGLTIGLQGIFTSGQTIMLVRGDREEAAYQASMSRRIVTSIPVSLLQLYSNCVTLVDDTIQK